jgi:hypothetical protein
MRAMAKKSSRKIEPPEVADEFSEPITIPFRGMFHDPATGIPGRGMFGQPSTSVSAQDLMRDAAARQVQKLHKLGAKYGCDLTTIDGWQQLCLRIASDYHPGFKVECDDWQVRYFHMLYGFTPMFPLKGNCPRTIPHSQKGWPAASKLLQPELLALMIGTERQIELSEERICEAFVESADDQMKKRMYQSEKSQRTATLVRRLSEGRNRQLKQKLGSGKKTRG